MKTMILALIVFSPFFFVNNTNAAVVDSDKDGLKDDLEISLGTDINNPDSDADGYKDGEEVASGFNPLIGNKDKSLNRRAEVNLSTQTLSYYLGDVLIGTMPVSTGVRGMDTPKGEFSILKKVPSVTYRGANYNYPNTKWNLMFKKSYYLHGAYWHNQFGKKPMSHGCVNIAYKDVGKLYKFMQVGDKVKVVGKTPSRVAVKK